MSQGVVSQLRRVLTPHSTRIAARASDIDILESPAAFYDQLMEGVRNARESVTIASLYLGTGDKEVALVDEIRRACAARPGLRVTFLFDHSRGTRGGEQSTAGMLQPLVAAFPTQVHAGFLRMPQLRSWLASRLPARYNEGVSVQHMKAYVFDDTTLLSGANLSHDYFTNRRDRYWVFRSNEGVAAACASAVHAVTPFASVVRAGSWRPRAEVPEAERADKRTRARLRDALLHATRGGGGGGESNGNRVRASGGGSGEPAAVEDAGADTEVHLALNMSPLGIHSDADATCGIARAAVLAGLPVHLATGYLNPPRALQRVLLGGCAAGALEPAVTIATADPRANGFYAPSGGHPSGAVPLGYSLIARDFLRACDAAGQGQRVTVREWFREGWTFHAKGMWVGAREGTGEVALATIGSPNFGRRSFERDLELQAYVSSSCPDLRRRMGAERDAVFADTAAVTLDTFEQPSRRVRWDGGWTHGVWVEGARRVLGPLL